MIALLPRQLEPIDVGSAALLDVVFYDEEIGDDVLGAVGFFVPIYMGPRSNLEYLQRMPHLQVCQLQTAGFDHVLSMLDPGVTLCNAGGVHDASTAELAVGLILASLRGIDEAARAQAQGSWEHLNRPALADRQVVVVGAGGVGSAIRRRLEPFEVTVTMVGRSARDGILPIDDLAAALPGADVVVLAVPLDVRTAGMVDASFLAAMKDGSLLVNVARGGVVDTDALLAEVVTGRLHAALDVTDPEPLPPDHPLWLVPNVLVTPHLGGDTSAFLPRSRRLVEGQLGRWSAGEPLLSVVSRNVAG